METMRHEEGARSLVFVVDDDPSISQLIRIWVEREGFDCEVFDNGPEALAALKRSAPDVICLDLWMRPMDGMQVFEQLQEIDDALPVIFLTGEDSVETAVKVMRAGAFDYQVKPLKRDRFLLSLRNAFERRAMQSELLELRAQLREQRGFGELIGTSGAMQALFSQLRKVARSDVSVMVLGESGTGKELIARAIHQHSSRRHRPFIAVNCGAIPEELLESELFGHRKGAFTGAAYDRKGKFELADRGVLFLDEIGELSPAAQVRLLRVLQESEFEPVGSNRKIEIDVRVISATHRDLERRIREGYFREDLYYRLMVYPIHVPPLRARKDDIPLLCRHFLDRFGDEARPVRFEGEALELLCDHDWPGNVRELENMVKFALVSCEGDVIRVADLPPRYREPARDGSSGEQRALEGGATSGIEPVLSPDAVLPMEELERRAIQQALEASQGNVSQAARSLGMGRTTLYRKMAQYGIRPR